MAGSKGLETEYLEFRSFVFYPHLGVFLLLTKMGHDLIKGIKLTNFDPDGRFES